MLVKMPLKSMEKLRPKLSVVLRKILWHFLKSCSVNHNVLAISQQGKWNLLIYDSLIQLFFIFKLTCHVLSKSCLLHPRGSCIAVAKK